MARRILCAALCLAALLPRAQAQSPNQPDAMIVTLVGTGGPELTPTRAGPSTLIQAGGQTLLIDAGRGVLDGLYRSHILPQTVTRIFLTHLHSDHIVGLPDLWITPWFLLGRSTPLELWGPPGTQALVDGMRQMYAHDLERRSNPAFPRATLDIQVHEIRPGIVYRQGGLTITATAVEHADGDPAFAYRIQTSAHSVFLTGDCTLTPALEQAAHGVDLLIANVAAATPALEATPRLQPILAKLLRPEQAAQLFQNAAPHLAVYSHIVKKDLPGPQGDALILARTRAAGYAGPLRIGHDRERIVIDARIRIHAAANPPTRDLDGPSSTLP